MIGIYKITNILTGQVYIGQSVNIERRISQHKYLLKENKAHNKHLQSSFNKYGTDCFEYEIVCECEEELLNKLETKYILKFETIDKNKGFNKNCGGDSKRPTEEWKLNMSKKMKGRIISKETRRKLSISRTGYKATKELKKKLSECFKKSWEFDDDRKRKYSEMFTGQGNSFYGKKHNNETILKLSEYAKNRPKEHNENISKSLKEKNIGELNKSSRKVICITTGEIFKTIKEAGEIYCVNPSDISACCRQRQKSAGRHKETNLKLVWEYI